MGSNAQFTQNIRGTIIDKDSKMPLPFANVVISTVEPIKGAASDIDGRFKIEYIPVGRHTIKASFIGYEPVVFQNIEILRKFLFRSLVL